MTNEHSTLDAEQFHNEQLDPYDEQIAGALRARLDTPSTDVTAAHRDVIDRAGRIRRRRTSMMTVGTTAVLVVGSWAAISARGGDTTVRMAEPEVTTSVTATSVTATTLPSSTVTTTVTTSVPTVMIPGNPVITTGNTIDDSGNDFEDGSEDDSDDDFDDGADDTSEVITGNTITGNTITGNTITGNTIDDSGDDGPDVNTASTTATTVTTSTTATTVTTSGSSTTVAAGPAPFTETYDSSGGSITVAWNGSSLSLEATNPQSGYTAEVEDALSDRVRVRFRSESGGDSRIEVRIEAGQATVDID